MVDEGPGFDDGVERGGGDGEIIGKGAVRIAFDAFEEYEEGVVAESKKESEGRAGIPA